MTRLYLVTQGERQIWVAALIDEDIWTYVGNTGKFHLNDGVRHDFFMLNEAKYSEIGLSEAHRLIKSGVGLVDEQQIPDSVQKWRDDPEAMEPEIVFASLAADLS
ncbi:MAG TPA: hypothetical protein VFG33_18155 [Kribbella sp.]|uniref:hypothetical protein n=1 Tax=Kribbella sp. TaxID=1871183 RepID=UPI002D7729CA|nr:hypothetical protein [Kribbella sp.]HET6295314.1 hypothetical protein [Kribbella sp.]